jgi:hypothetical protein
LALEQTHDGVGDAFFAFGLSFKVLVGGRSDDGPVGPHAVLLGERRIAVRINKAHLDVLGQHLVIAQQILARARAALTVKTIDRHLSTQTLQDLGGLFREGISFRVRSTAVVAFDNQFSATMASPSSVNGMLASESPAAGP